MRCSGRGTARMGLAADLSVRHTRARMTSRPKPPPILNGARVLAFASMGQGRRPSADGRMYFSAWFFVTLDVTHRVDEPGHIVPARRLRWSTQRWPATPI